MKENPQGTELRPFSSAANERHSYKGRIRLLLASFSESQGLNHQPFSSIPNPCDRDAIHKIANGAISAFSELSGGYTHSAQ